jgi:hypothetical protein
MKTIHKTLIFLLVALGTTSCKDKLTEELDMNVPVYMDYGILRSSVRPAESRELVNPGKIYFKDHYIFVVERQEGVHLIDVSNPAQPQNKVFIEVPGCTDIAVRDQSLYADSFIDLVVIDLSNPANPREINRITNIFPYTIPSPENAELPYAEVDTNKGIVTGWVVKREKRKLEQEQPYYPPYPIWAEQDNHGPAYLTNGGSSSGASFGKSGSMARFGLYDDYLYIAEEYQLYLIDLSEDKPSLAYKYRVSDVETMFIYDDHLFFGTPSGMIVYSLETPFAPQLIGSFWHVNSCDPVVVQDGYAYITLRGGTECSNSVTNRLDVVECSDDYTEYTLVNSYVLTEPFGLGIDGNTLFICDGKDGLKVYDVTDKQTINKHLLTSFPTIQSYDVIPVNGYLFMVGNDGFYLYDYSDIQNIRQIGHIPVTKK